MSELGYKKILDMILSDNSKKLDLKKMGISEQELDSILASIPEFKPSTYKRVMNKKERSIFQPEAFGYLVKLVHQHSISKEQFEKIIDIAFNLFDFIKQEITYNMVDVIMNYVVFTGMDMISIRDLLELIYEQENELQNNPTAN